MENQALSGMAKTMVRDRVLIVAPSWIGDAVLSLPVVDASANLWPDSDVTVLARAGTAEIFSARESEIEVLEYGWGTGYRKIGNMLKWGRRLRQNRYQVALLLPNSLGTAMLVWMAGIPKRAGYATERAGGAPGGRPGAADPAGNRGNFRE